MNDGAVDLALIDAQAGEVLSADLIFIFGTRHWTPAELAAELYHAGRAPLVVTTGGPNRHPRGVSEAVMHQRLLGEQEFPKKHSSWRIARPQPWRT